MGTKELLQNAEVVAGTGEQCLPFDEARCGDGGKATEALLLGPKGKETERPLINMDTSWTQHTFVLSHAHTNSIKTIFAIQVILI